MRNVGRNDEVCKAFASNEAGPNRNQQHNVFFEKDTLYSYGYHFPLAFRNVNGSNGQIVVNGDKYSVTTSGHQSLIQRASGNAVTISLSAFVAAGLYDRHDKGIMAVLLDSEPAISKWFDDDKELSDIDTKSLPPGVTFWKSIDKETKKVFIRGYHRAGLSLWKTETDYFLAGMDENQFFVSKLNGPSSTCIEALENLKPNEVKQAYVLGLNVARQGDWFFIDITDHVDKKERKSFWKVTKPGTLIGQYDRQNAHSHKIDRLGHLVDIAFTNIPDIIPKLGLNGKTTLASGRVTHQEHKMLKLGKRNELKLWIVSQNTATGNWSSSGKVD